MGILNLPPTSASVERSFSRHSKIHSNDRNRLTTERAAKLVFIAHNLTLEKQESKNIRETPELSQTGEDIVLFSEVEGSDEDEDGGTNEEEETGPNEEEDSKPDEEEDIELE